MVKKAEKNKNLMILLSILAIAVIIIVGVFYYFVVLGEETEKTEEIEAVEEIDDRISPLTNQGLIFEINRMRHRGLIDIIMKRGSSWRNPPQFYFVTMIDDQEYISKDVWSRKGTTETFFAEWDTMFMENKISRNANEEQEFSEITLQIFEREKTGLLGLRTQDIEKEIIKLTYDYKTGRWDGDDSFNDSDGYGHHVGENFEIWFNVYQTDFDHDGIPYWTEVNILKTNPKIDDSKLDPDEDGIPTTWEWKWGYFYNISDNHSVLDPDMDGLENIEEYKMAKWFADPFSQDIYIEVDGMEKKGFFDIEHVFWEESQQIFIERFAQHGINVYIDDGWPDGPINGGGEKLPYYERISQDSGMMLQFYNNHFPEERKGIFRYLVLANSAGFCHPAEFNMYDEMAVGNGLSRMISITRRAFTPRTWRIALASGIMHEMGHSLGIGPWNVPGNDNLSYSGGRAAKQDYLEEHGNYVSVMNYYYIWDHTIADYSDGTNGRGDVNDWEMFDLTFFQTEGKVVEDPGFELPGEEEI